MGGKASSKGRITVPKEVRDALGIKPGDELECEIVGDHFVGRKRAPEGRWAHLIGIFSRDPTFWATSYETLESASWDCRVIVTPDQAISAN